MKPTNTWLFAAWYRNPPPFGIVTQRPPQRMVNLAGPMLVGLDLPDLFESDAVMLRIGFGAQVVTRHQVFAEVAAATFGKYRVTPDEFIAALETSLGLAVLANAHVARGDTAHGPVGVIQDFGRSESGKEIDFECFCLFAEPLAQTAETDDEVAAIVHRPRNERGRDCRCTLLAEQVVKGVAGDRRFKRRTALLPVAEQFLERTRLEYVSGKNMGADFGAFLDDDNAEIRTGFASQLLETAGRRQPGRTGTDNDHIKLHGFAFDFALNHSGSPGARSEDGNGIATSLHPRGVLALTGNAGYAVRAWASAAPDRVMDFVTIYEQELTKRGYDNDDAQRRAALALAELGEALVRTEAGRGFLARFRGDPPPPRGLYLWGGVGRGKTFLMDLFFNAVPIARKHRSHFHRFMRLIHEERKRDREAEDPLRLIADRLAAQHRLICFDEFFVSDITDAMLLGRLLQLVFDRGVVLVATSNVAPSGLYRDGLQRERFLPAIEALESHCKVLPVDGERDYRLERLEAGRLYLTPDDEGAREELLRIFRDIAPGAPDRGRSIVIEGRPIETVQVAKGIGWFDFDALCRGPRSQNDYIEIARLYHTVILSGVPILSRQDEDAARRFIALVDEFYDRRVKLIVSAAAEIERLYAGTRLGFEFERTASRLLEMRSHEYLTEAHRA